MKVAQAVVEEPVGENIGANLLSHQGQDLQARFNEELFYTKVLESCDHSGSLCNTDSNGGYSEEPIGEILEADLLSCQGQDLQAQFNEEPFCTGVSENWDHSGLLFDTDNIGGYVKEPARGNLEADLVLRQDQDLQAQVNEELFWTGVTPSWDHSDLLCNTDNIGGNSRGCWYCAGL
ncbi:hypothetical protein BP5796_09598 [Coleophoma crateriformis]|uniref:Uncharacterized protein n=1 Tax=Coleophoma crateriformis TaxID=565419 RepID=A0A3D8QYI5_9HELO|nr:hypothetical protein BP5796_09598 [Coleophoma crateriformis]